MTRGHEDSAVPAIGTTGPAAYCSSCGGPVGPHQWFCHQCRRLSPAVALTFVALTLACLLAAQWYFFLWKVVPPAASLLMARGARFSSFVSTSILIARSLGQFWWFVLPLLAWAIGTLGLLWRPMRGRGGITALAAVVVAQLISAAVFLMAPLQAFIALGGL